VNKHNTSDELEKKGSPEKPVGGIEPEHRNLRFNIARDAQARVLFTGRVTQEAITKFCALLELSKDTFPTEAELDEASKCPEHGG